MNEDSNLKNEFNEGNNTLNNESNCNIGNKSNKLRNIVLIIIIIILLALIILSLLLKFLNKKEESQGVPQNYSVEGYVGEYDGEAHGIKIISDEAKIKYGISEGVYDLLESPTRIEVGTTTVYYQILLPGQEPINDFKNIVINPAENKLTLSSNEGNYENLSSKTFEITENKSGGELSCESDKPKMAVCSIKGTKVTVKTVPSNISEPETVKITIKSSSTKNYKQSEVVYTASIEGILKYTSSDYIGNYDGKSHGIKVLSDGATIKYGTSDGVYDLLESPTRIDVGATTVYYQITKSRYQTITGSKKIVINKADGNATLSKNNLNVGYNENETIAINDETGTIKCESENPRIATCSINNSILTIKGIDFGTTRIKVNIEESKNYNSISKIIDVKSIKKCKFNGNLVQGVEFIDGQYTYRYKQQQQIAGTGSTAWRGIDIDGWGVTLTDKDSTTPVTTELCGTINDKPIVSTSWMFSVSQATQIDLSRMDTSNVVNMEGMFDYSKATNLDLRGFDTSNVTNMSNMFGGSQVASLDLSNFDTSNVTDMSDMFHSIKSTSLDLRGFDTSNVSNMSGMFYCSKVRSLDLRSFDTSNVTSMSSMFAFSDVASLNLSSFDTSKVTTMSDMFRNSLIRSIDLSNFNTSNVKNMSGMFWNSLVETLDLSSFDTSNVTNVLDMFTNATSKNGYARTQTDADRFNASSNKPSLLIFITK